MLRLELVVSIINYRTAEMTLACLTTVLPEIEGLNARVVVVDNASGDGSAERIDAWIAEKKAQNQVVLVRSQENGGFSSGHNQAMQTFEADYYLVLNSDALARQGACRALLRAAQLNPQAGLVAPRLEGQDGSPQESCFKLPSPGSEIIRGACTGPVTKILKRYDTPLGLNPKARDVGWASFACILLRHDMIRDVGWMDEGYFLYFEDTEYCMRARRANWLILPVPEAKFVHLRGGSAPVKSLAAARKRLPKYFYASRSRLFYQGYGHTGLLLANLGWHLGRSLAFLRVLIGKGYPKSNACEWRDLWTNFMNPLGPPYETNK